MAFCYIGGLRIDFTPVSEAQKQFVLDDTHKVAVALGGQRAGKTHSAVIKTLRHVMDYPGARVWFVAPDLDRLEEGLLAKFRELCPPNLLLEHKISIHQFLLANDSNIRWRSTDVSGGIRGGERSFAVFDEAAWSPYSQERRAYADLRARLSLHQRTFWCSNEWLWGQPSVEVLEQGTHQSLVCVTYRQQLTVTTTPKIGSFTNEMLDMPPDGVAIYHLHTQDNLSHLPPGYMDDLRAAYQGTLFLQEAMGELVGVESADYPAFDPRAHVMAGPQDYKLVVGGIDWGYRNSLAVVVFGFTSTGVAFGLEEWGGSHIDLDQIVLKCAELQAKHGIKVFYCDQAEPANISFLNRHGISAVKQAVVQKAYRTAAVASRLQRTPTGTYRFYLHPSMRETIRCMRRAGDSTDDPSKMKEVKSGKPGNDFSDATEYAITGGERLMGSPFAPAFARGHKRHESGHVGQGVPFKFLG